MSQPVNHHGCDSNRRRATTHEQPQQPTRSLSFLGILLLRSAPPPRRYGHWCRRCHHRSMLNSTMQRFWVWGFRFPATASFSLAGTATTRRHHSLSLARRCVRVRVLGILGESERGRQRGVREAERGWGFWGSEKWCPKMRPPCFICFCLSFISSYYY